MTGLDTSALAGLITSMEGDLEYIEGTLLTDVYPDETQPRYKNLTPEGVEDIRATLRLPPYRIWQPILVQEKDDKGHKIIMGGRRYLASTLEDKETIPTLVVKSGVDTEKVKLLIQVIENTARKALDPREEGDAFIRLKALGMTGKEIAEVRAKPASYVSECIMMREMELDENLSFLNELYDQDLLVDPTGLAALVRVARKNKEACKRLVDWAKQEDCLNRKWAQSIKNVDLESSFEEQIQSFEDRKTVEKTSRSKTPVAAGMTGDNDERSPSEKSQEEEIVEQPAQKGNKSSSKDSSVENDSDKDESGADGVFSKRPLSKAKVSVTHNDMLAFLLLDRVDAEEGFAWISYENSEDGPARVSVDELSLIHVG